MHRAAVLLRVSIVVAFCAALIGGQVGGQVGLWELRLNHSFGTGWCALANLPRVWPGSGLVLRCLGPGFTVLALGEKPILITMI